jgi:FlgN protein
VIAVVEHLERQVESARRLLGILLAQTEAIKAQDVEGVLARLRDVQAEMTRRMQLERERDLVLRQAAALLRRPADEVTLETMLVLLTAPDAARARELSAELKGLLGETARVHGQNRVLVRQELAFLDHLMRLLSGAPQAGYTPVGHVPATQPGNLVDMRV